jgi:L-alanine-DL-glutamate epimerase-like enolase superfamily enzyme
MKITNIKAYRVELPLHEGSYKWSGGKSVAVFDSTVVAIETDASITGYGEACPLGPAYLPAYAAGARTGITELAPHLIGQNPTELGPLNHLMDRALRGHPYVKAALDVACWDILGKASRQERRHVVRRAVRRRLRTLPRDFARYAGAHDRERGQIPRRRLHEIPAQSRAACLKPTSRAFTPSRLSCNPGDVLIADANTGWTQHQALRVVDAVRDVDVYIEQPCFSYEECLAVRRKTARPFVLDEVIDDLHMVVRGFADQAMDVINLKISKVGGLTKARQIRDLCVG